MGSCYTQPPTTHGLVTCPCHRGPGDGDSVRKEGARGEQTGLGKGDCVGGRTAALIIIFAHTLHTHTTHTAHTRAGDLVDLLCRAGHYTEAAAARCTRDVLTAVAYMHDMGVLHRDIKLENFLYAQVG